LTELHVRPDDGSSDEVWSRRWALRYVKDSKVTHGKDGWLFLDNDTNWFLRQYSGEVRLSDEQLAQWERLLEYRVGRLGELGARYHFLIAPESPAVYPEKLPDEITVAPERTVQQLLAHLDATGSRANVVYPLEELLAAKAQRLLYPKIDTHWNDFGAFIAYKRLARELKRDVAIHEVDDEEVDFFDAELHGDLGHKLGVPAHPQPCARYLYARARKLHDNRVLSRGSLVILENPHAPPTTCVMFGDSCASFIMPFIAQTFRRLVWAWSSAVDYDLVRQERPDVVVSQMIERFLIVVPDDLTAKSVAQLEAEKKEARMVRPSLAYWDPIPDPTPPDPSIAAIEAARARLLARERSQDATLLCVAAYAGLSPSESLQLRWEHIGEGEISVEGREVRLLAPLAEDIERWRALSGDAKRGYVFPDIRLAGWTRWIEHELVPLTASTVPPLDVKAITGAFALLLIAEGETPSGIARAMGLGRDVVVANYWHLLQRVAPGRGEGSAAELIRESRAAAKPSRLRSLVPRALRRILFGHARHERGPVTDAGAQAEPLPVDTVEAIRLRLLEDGTAEEAAFVSLIAYAGVAQAKARRLRWDELEELRLPAPITRELAELRKTSSGDGFVFGELRTRDWQEWIAERYAPAAAMAGLGRDRPHYLRHTFARLMIEQGVSLEEIGELLGLTRQEALERYAHLVSEARAETPVPAADRIERARSGAGLSAAERV
jgi:alginate O-acetyltransferase complex protein AlgJ